MQPQWADETQTSCHWCLGRPSSISQSPCRTSGLVARSRKVLLPGKVIKAGITPTVLLPRVSASEVRIGNPWRAWRGGEKNHTYVVCLELVLHSRSLKFSEKAEATARQDPPSSPLLLQQSFCSLPPHTHALSPSGDYSNKKRIEREETYRSNTIDPCAFRLLGIVPVDKGDFVLWAFLFLNFVEVIIL